MLNLTIDEAELKYKDITETEGYKSGLKLLNHAFHHNREEITRQALMRSGGNLTQGLSILKSEGYDLMQKLQENALEDASEEYR